MAFSCEPREKEMVYEQLKVSATQSEAQIQRKHKTGPQTLAWGEEDVRENFLEEIMLILLKNE